MKKVRGEDDIEAALHRLDRLTLDEGRATAAQTLDVYGLVRDRRVVLDGEIAPDGNNSAARISRVLGVFQIGNRQWADSQSLTELQNPPKKS